MAERPLEERGRREEVIEGEESAIIRVEPHHVNEYLIRALSATVAEQDTEVQQNVARMSGIAKKMMAYATLVVKYLLSDIDAVVPILAAESHVATKVTMAGHLLLAVWQKDIEDLVRKLNMGVISDDEFEKLIEELVYGPEALYLALLYVMNRIDVLMHANMPVHMRPPLINLRVGMEVVRL